MKIAAAINGSMISEKSAQYALLHSRAMKVPLLLFFNQNAKDELKRVQESADRIQAMASELEVSCQFESANEDNDRFIRRLVLEHQLDIIYCSTRAEKNFFDHSFSERLVNLHLNCSIAVVKVASMGSITNLTKIGLYARNQKLKTELFNLSAALCKSLDSTLVLTTNLKEKKTKLLDLPFSKKRRRLNLLDQNLKPYLQLAKLMGIHSTIYHLYEEDVQEEHLAYVLSRNIDLLIFEAYKWPFVPLRLKNPAEALFKMIPINCIIYYPTS